MVHLVRARAGAPIVRHTWSKVLVALYPVATLFCILVTGNHYWVDAVAGLLFLAVGYLLGSMLAKATSRWSDRRDAAARRRPARRL